MAHDTQHTFRVAAYVGGILPTAAWGKWKNRDEAEAFAARKRDECDRRGWGHDIVVERDDDMP